MNNFKTLLIVMLFAAAANAVEMGMPIQLKLKDPSGNYPDATGVTFTVQVLSPSNGCVLREEDFANQTVASGTVSLALGSGNRAGYDPNIGTLAAVYDNLAAKNNLTCVDSNNTVVSSNQTYNPASTDTRIIRVRATINASNIVVDFIQRAAPYALHAESVGGKAASDILVQNGGTSLNQANLETLLSNATRFNKLQNLAVNGVADAATAATTAGTATNFTANLVGDVTGTQSATVVAAIRGVTVAATAPSSGQVLGYDGSQYVPMTFVASAPVASVNGQTGAVVLNSSHIAGVVTSGTSLLGDVTGNVSATVVSTVGGKAAASIAATVNTVNAATALSTANTLALRDGSGNLVAANVVATGASLQNIYLYEGSNTNRVLVRPPSSFSDYTLVLPTTDGNSGEVLQTDGSGNLSWAVPSGVTSSAIVTALGYSPADDAAVVKKSNNLSDLASATVARANLGLGAAAVLNVGTAAGTVAAGDDSRITGALQQSAFNSYVASASCAAGQSMYWNSASSQFLCQDVILSGDATGSVSSVTVIKVQGVGVSFASIANNHIVQYNGTNLINRAIPTCAGGEYLTFNGTAWSCVTDASSALASLSVTAPISSTGGANPTLSIPQASGSQNGYLSNSDWTTFNSKVTSSAASIAQVLGYTAANSATVALKANNLSDLASATVARANLGLGDAAVLNVGTAAGTVAAGDDSRITGALAQSAFNTYVASANCTTTQTMYWNSVSSTFSCQDIAVSGDISGVASSVTVTKLQNTGVSFASIANGHILQYNGTNIINRAIPTCSSGQYLTFSGTAWSCAADAGAGSGIVSAITVAAPLQTTGGSTPTLSMAQASGSVSGYLTGTDWTTFNNKLASSTASIVEVLGFTPADSSTVALKANNLSDLTNVATARTNLGLGDFATASTIDLGSASATGTLATARLPAFAGDVSSTAGSNSLTVQKIQGVAVDATAPTQGQVLVYDGVKWVPSIGLTQYGKVSSNIVIPNNTYVDLTNLTFNAVSGNTYKFRFTVVFSIASTTRSPRFLLGTPTATVVAAQAQVPYSTSVITSTIIAAQSGTATTASSNSVNGQVLIAIIEGIIVPSANGPVKLQASPSATANMTVYAGSTLEWTQVP